MTAQVKNAKLLQKEVTPSDFIPYLNHVTPEIISLSTGDYMSCFRVDGIAHDSADDEDINLWHEGFNTFLRNVASPNLAIWTHLIRRPSMEYPDASFSDPFTAAFNQKYKQHLTAGGAQMYVNELFISLVWRTHPNAAAKAASFLEKADRESIIASRTNAIEKLNEIGSTLVESLRRYEPTPLRAVESDGVIHSEPASLIAHLVNGEKQKIPVSRSTIANLVPTTRPLFGTEYIAIHGGSTPMIGAVLGIKEYPSLTGPGMLDSLLSMPFSFTMTQSFTFTPKAVASSMLTRQRDIMLNAGDMAISQIDEITQALDDLISNRFVYGEYHFNLLIWASEAKELQQNVALARNALADCAMVVAREDLANEAAFWAQLPGNFRLRPRVAPVTSLNFAGLSAMHNTPTGKQHGNHWGQAVALLKTSSGSPYYFNFHQRDLGNTIIIGPSGSGKTVIQGFLMAMLDKFQPTCVFFDKDRGAEIFVRAMGGDYHVLQTGAPTGWNPFQLDPTPQNISFLQRLVRSMIGHGAPLLARQEKELDDAVVSLMSLSGDNRKLGQLLSFLDPTESDGLWTRLHRWTAGNALGWVFDNATDSLDMRSATRIGFDMTQILDQTEVKTPALLYLMHRMEEVIDGRRFACFMDEFWRLLQDPAFEDFAQNKLKTIRKLNGFLAFGTQDPRDTLASPISHTIIGQCPTQIFMPNPKASREDYVGGFHLSNREFEIIKSIPESSRMFLIKQGQNSVVAELNLKGFDNELAVLSGTATNVALVDELLKTHGTDPQAWLPEFHARRRAS